jgi:hypothetical protein
LNPLTANLVVLAKRIHMSTAQSHISADDGMPPSVCLRGKRKSTMSLKLIAAVALSLLAASPAVAMQRGNHHRYSHQHARKFDYRSVYGAYGFDPGGDFAPGNAYDDFARRNTFN